MDVECRDAAASLVAELGLYLEDPGMKLDENGVCSAVIEGIRFSFFYDSSFSALFIQALLGNVEDSDIETLLYNNHLWEWTAGGIFGENPDDGLIYFSYRLDLPLAGGHQPVFLCLLMQNILGAIEATRENMAQAGDGVHGVPVLVGMA